MIHDAGCLFSCPTGWPIIEWHSLHVTFVYDFLVCFRFSFVPRNQTSWEMNQGIQLPSGAHQGSKLLDVSLTYECTQPRCHTNFHWERGKYCALIIGIIWPVITRCAFNFPTKKMSNHSNLISPHKQVNRNTISPLCLPVFIMMLGWGGGDQFMALWLCSAVAPWASQAASLFWFYLRFQPHQRDAHTHLALLVVGQCSL